MRSLVVVVMRAFNGYSGASLYRACLNYPGACPSRLHGYVLTGFLGYLVGVVIVLAVVSGLVVFGLRFRGLFFAH